MKEKQETLEKLTYFNLVPSVPKFFFFDLLFTNSRYLLKKHIVILCQLFFQNRCSEDFTTA